MLVDQAAEPDQCGQAGLTWTSNKRCLDCIDGAILEKLKIAKRL